MKLDLSPCLKLELNFILDDFDALNSQETDFKAFLWWIV